LPASSLQGLAIVVIWRIFIMNAIAHVRIMCLDCQKEEKEHFVKSVALFYKNKISTQGCLKTKGRKIFINFLVVDTAWFRFCLALINIKSPSKGPWPEMLKV
jgi:hypothetical protein